MRLSVIDAVSPSYFIATAAVELGFFKDEGVDIEFVPPPANPSQALRDGDIDFLGASPYMGLTAFPGWRDAKLLCALSHYTYWVLAIRADLPGDRGDIAALKGLRISAGRGPGQALGKLLEDAGIDAKRDNVQIIETERSPDGNWARDGIRAIESGKADGFWGNALRSELGVDEGVAKVLLDIRRGDGPAIARSYTFPALMTTSRVVETHPDAAAGTVRAIVKTQHAIRADPTLAMQAAARLFPPREAELNARILARDSEFFDPTITAEMVEGASRFAQRMGVLDGDVSFEEVVALQYRDLWA